MQKVGDTRTRYLRLLFLHFKYLGYASGKKLQQKDFEPLGRTRIRLHLHSLKPRWEDRQLLHITPPNISHFRYAKEKLENLPPPPRLYNLSNLGYQLFPFPKGVLIKVILEAQYNKC